jgi:HD domain
MPLLVACEDLQAGMRLAQPFEWFGATMLPAGKVLAAEDVSLMRRKYPEVSLRVGDPVLDSLADFQDDSRDREVAATARKRIAASMAEVQQRFTSHAALGGVNFEMVKSAAIAVLEFLRDNPVSAALLDHQGDPAFSPMGEHAGGVFYLALVLGSAVRDYVVKERVRHTSAVQLSPTIALNLLPLGLGAMFMDVGMLELGHMMEPGYVLTDADRTALREHPAHGAEMLPDNLPAGVKNIVRTHHENYDGTGYPNRIDGQKLHVFTRIVRICDAFVAATSHRAHRPAKSPARAIWEMRTGPWRNCYDPVLVRVFTSLIQPFPIGAKLTLRDGRGAVVVKYNRPEPFEPMVIVAFDADGGRLPQLQMVGPIRLGAESDLYAQCYAGEDLSYLYGDAPQPSPAPLPENFENVLAAMYP